MGKGRRRERRSPSLLLRTVAGIQRPPADMGVSLNKKVGESNCSCMGNKKPPNNRSAVLMI
jgi:hypothetical protein